MKRFLAISVGIHALAVFVFRPFPSTEKPIPESEPFEVTQAQVPRPERRGAEGRGRGANARIGVGAKPSLSLRDLGISWQRRGNIAIPSGHGGRSTEAREERDESAAGLLGTPLAYVRHTVLFHQLHERIESALDYPKEFRDADIEGLVAAHLWFDSLGRYSPERSYVRSDSNYLRVYVRRLFRRVFSAPIPLTFLAGRESLSLDCHFRFELSRREDVLDAAPGEVLLNPAKTGVVGRHLSFYRGGRNFGSWTWGPISGYGIAPTVGIDPDWFLEAGEKLFSQNAKPDPLLGYREDRDW